MKKIKRNKSLVVSSKIPRGDKYIPEAWLEKLLKIIDNPRDKAYIMYHVETGLRVSDVLGTFLENVHMDEQRAWTFDHKKDEWRWVYFPKDLKPVIKMWLRKRGNDKGKLFDFHAKTANRILKKWCKEIGFRYHKEVSTHWLRHTFIRLSRKKGRDMKAVQQNTGDTVETILYWYGELSSDDMRDEMNKKPLIGDNK